MTTLLDKIEAELRTCTDAIRQVDLIAERACYLARTGKADLATRIATELRGSSGRIASPRVMLWVMIIEGLVLFFGKLSSSAEDRMQRAFALSNSLGVADLADIAASWLAHFQFDRSDYAGMALHLHRVLSRAEQSPDAALMRAAIVAADAYIFAGNDRAAQPWYEIARLLASETGDRTSMGAIMYNRAAFGLAYLSANSAVTGTDIDPDRLRLALVEIESARSFELGTQVTALSHLTRLCRAQVLLLARRWAEAASELEPILHALETIDDRPKRPDIRADLAWCWLNSGQHDKAKMLSAEISIESAQAMDVDDQVTFLARFISLREALGPQPPTAVEHEMFRRARDGYLQQLESLRAELQGLPPAPAIPLSRCRGSLPAQHT